MVLDLFSEEDVGGEGWFDGEPLSALAVLALFARILLLRLLMAEATAADEARLRAAEVLRAAGDVMRFRPAAVPPRAWYCC